MKVIYHKDTAQKVPVKIWGDLENIDAKAINQTIQLASLPMIFKWVSLMPDAHFCNGGCSVGTVMPVKDYVFPTVVGSDGGCGIAAWKTGLNINEIDVQSLITFIQKTIPIFRNIDTIHEFESERHADLKTLGNSNHFLSLEKDEKDNAYILIHTGSRNFGAQIFKKHIAVARRMHSKYFCNTSPECPFLPMQDQAGQDYYKDMRRAVEFARLNRELMYVDIYNYLKSKGHQVSELKYTDTPHNFAAYENHFGANVIVHRKGASAAPANSLVVIPGSMSTKSYIVQGKGNEEAFKSSSHGAGRLCSRKESKEKLAAGHVPSVQDQLGDKIVFGTPDFHDELGYAYKDIDSVMEQQKDLVEIQTKLTPVATYKG